MEITVNKDGQDLGPYSLEQLQAELAARNLASDDFAWFEGCEDWISVADVPGIGATTPAGDTDGIYIEKDGEQTGPFPLPQIQGLLNQGELSADDRAWIEGWGDWGVLGDVPGINKPRVRVKAAGSPLSGIAPGGASSSSDKKSRKGKTEPKDEAEPEKKSKRGRKRKSKEKKQGVMGILVPIAAVLILCTLGAGGYIIVKGMMEGDAPMDSVRDKFVKEEPPPLEDPWLLTQWRNDRRKS